MNGPDRFGQGPSDSATESRAFGPSFGYLVIALLLVAGGIGYWAASPDEPTRVASSSSSSSTWTGASHDVTPAADSAPAGPATAAASSPASAPTLQDPRMRDPHGDLTPDLRDYLNPGEKPTMHEVLDRLHRAGVYTGIGAFSPPGTKPVLLGLAVPEDFTLPEGYVRHYQTGESGQPIEPILMYAPDRQFFDAAGRPIAVPKDRVVPPEQAPPGLPIRRVTIPAPIEPDESET